MIEPARRCRRDAQALATVWETFCSKASEQESVTASYRRQIEYVAYLKADSNRAPSLSGWIRESCMLGCRLKLMLAWAATCVCADAIGQFTIPNPKVFVRAEDQMRARLLRKPCTETDEGRACYRYDGRLIREAPCTHHLKAGVIGSLPTDQCYKMRAPRRYRGIWIDEFEGQSFIPEGTKAPEWPRGDPKSSEWRKKADHAIAATIWLDVERVSLRHKWQREGRKIFIEFVGRKTMYPGNYGHLGMSGQEIIVDRVISLRECPETGVCG